MKHKELPDKKIEPGMSPSFPSYLGLGAISFYILFHGNNDHLYLSLSDYHDGFR